MPVVTIQLSRLMKMLKGPITLDGIVEAIPYLGLDIEDLGNDFIKVEYNPNRPDYSTDYGIARALNGLLGFELGCPELELKESGIEVFVDESVAKVRPYILCLVAKGLSLDDESIRQIITMQEDIHNGIGRRRRKVSIGIHNLDVIKPPIRYTASDS
ncbi:MAG: phenylalanine--tRNA ligase subunit beta, partial [Nitrososphaerota archaeon]